MGGIKILDSVRLAELDEYTITKEGIKSAELMERAATKCFQRLQEADLLKGEIIVICGIGNNGGDGWVIARLLKDSGYPVRAIDLNFTSKKSKDNRLNYHRFKNSGGKILTLTETKDIATINLGGKTVIDAIFGFGLTRPAKGLFAMVIEAINKSCAKNIISIDIPSGMYSDSINSVEDVMVSADYTYTFHAPKISFFFPEWGNYTGKIEVIDIGLDVEKADDMQASNFYLSAKEVGKLIKKRETFSHKGTYGHTKLIGGSRGKIGATILMGKGASFSGVGLVTMVVPSCGLNPIQSQLPTAMCEDQYGKNKWDKPLIVDEKFTYGVGPGIGTEEETTQVFYQFLKEVTKPIVIDADGLNILAKNKEWIRLIPKNSILTPHVGEFKRLVGDFSDSLERLSIQKEFAKKNNLFLILKDARTIIATPEGQAYFSLRGSSGMATGGSGDVLTGILAGLLAQGYNPLDVTRLGVCIHGVAGEKAAKKYTEYSMTSEQLVGCIPDAFHYLLSLTEG